MFVLMALSLPVSRDVRMLALLAALGALVAVRNWSTGATSTGACHHAATRSAPHGTSPSSNVPTEQNFITREMAFVVAPACRAAA